jgi:hypothetical protein
MKTVWVDFNDIAKIGGMSHTSTLNKFASEPLEVDDIVICEDRDGMSCQGRVLSVREDGLVDIFLDLNTMSWEM